MMIRAEWRRGAVIYQTYPRRLDSNADGIGDLLGVTAQADPAYAFLFPRQNAVHPCADRIGADLRSH
jgi:hypothetical protein